MLGKHPAKLPSVVLITENVNIPKAERGVMGVRITSIAVKTFTLETLMKKLFAMLVLTMTFAAVAATVTPQDLPYPTCLPCSSRT